MIVNTGIRRFHRWTSIAFTSGVIIYILCMTQGEPAHWIGLLAGVPLALLLFTGLYLFVAPVLRRTT